MQNTGVLVSAAVRPNDTLDLIASAFGNEIKGGHHGYASLSERDSLITERREWGMLVTVYNDGANNGTYQLTYNYVDTIITNNSNWTVFAGGGSTGTIEWVDTVFSRLGIEPGSPTVGDRYLITSPSGTWGSYPDHIAEWITSATWSYTVPRNGLSTRVDDQDNSIFRYEGSYPTGTWIKELVSQVRFITATSSLGITYTATPSPTFSYSTEMLYLTTFGITNSASASLNINGMGSIPIKKTTNIGLSDIVAGDLVPSVIYNMTYDGSRFQIAVPTNGTIYGGTGINVVASGGVATVSIASTGVIAGTYGNADSVNTFSVNAQGQLTSVGTQSISITSSQVTNFTSSAISAALASANFVDSNTVDFIANGSTVSAFLITGSLTSSYLNTGGAGATAGYILSVGPTGVFSWIPPIVGSASAGGTGSTIKYYIQPFEDIVVASYSQYWIYGNLTVAGQLTNYGQVVIADGSLVMSGGTFSNFGSLVFVTVGSASGTSSIISYVNTSTIGFTVVGSTVSAQVLQGSLTASHLNTFTGMGPTAGYILSVDNTGIFKWIPGTASQKSVMSVNDKLLTSIDTSFDGEWSGATISDTPLDDCYVSVYVNGLEAGVGNGVTNSVDCYFSSDGGVNARGFSSTHPNGKVQVNDRLYWNASVAGYGLISGWRVSLHYLI